MPASRGCASRRIAKGIVMGNKNSGEEHPVPAWVACYKFIFLDLPPPTKSEFMEDRTQKSPQVIV